MPKNTLLVLTGIAVACAGEAVYQGMLTTPDATAADATGGDASACGCAAEVEAAVQAAVAPALEQLEALETRLAELETKAAATADQVEVLSGPEEAAGAECSFTSYWSSGQVREKGACLCSWVNGRCVDLVRHGEVEEYVVTSGGEYYKHFTKTYQDGEERGLQIQWKPDGAPQLCQCKGESPWGLPDHPSAEECHAKPCE